MSNGVEVIVASDKNKIQQLNNKHHHHKNTLKISPSNLQKPLTLAPSTLKDQMILVMPSDKKNNLTISINPNQFLTKTCLTTYTYRTTYLQDGTTTVESREKVISNIATEERNYLKISPTASSGIILSKTPELAVGIFRTTYKYLNTFIDGEQPIVVSSKHVVTNTITGPNDYISFLQPSEDATPIHDTNTYFTKIMMTKTFQKNGISKILSTTNILTQVVVTESLPPKSISVMTSYIAFDDVDDNENVNDNDDDDDDDYDVTTKLSLSKATAAVAITKTKITSTKTKSPSLKISSINHNLNDHDNNDDDNNNLINNSENDIISSVLGSAGSLDNHKIKQTTTPGIHVYATKTYLTTFTYFTTLLKSNEHEVSSSIINSHTRVTKNVITETIPQYILNTNLWKTLTNLLLHGTKNPQGITTMATFPGGQSLEITAVKGIANTKQNHHNHNQISSTKHINAESTSSLPSLASSLASSNSDDSNSEGGIADSNDNSDDNEASGTSNDEVYDDQYYSQQTISGGTTKNVTKLSNNHHHHRPEFPPVSNLINSLNLDGLTALGPVFNAMAGLIQNNFKTAASSIIKKNNNTANPLYNIDNRHAAKNISSTYDNDLPHHHLPVYIPVQNVHGDNDRINNNNNNHHHYHHQNSNAGSILGINHGSPQSLHVSPPSIQDKWISDEKMNRNNKLEAQAAAAAAASLSLSSSTSIENKLTYEQPLLNGGIPISPGEVITANSDVIVGKPAGTRPRIPFNNKFKNDPLTASSTLSTVATSGKPNVSKYLSLSKYLENNNNNNNNNNKNGVYNKDYEQYIRPPPIPPPPLAGDSRLPFKNLLKYNENIGLGGPGPIAGNGNRKRIPHYTNKSPIFHHQNNEYEHPQHIPISGNLYQQVEKSPDNKGNNNGPIKTSEILEIKKMPEIYSTNLPPFEIYAHQHSHVKKVISSGKPMLVNIQPSQVANVVIPHGNSASVLIIESPVELHKNGEYFDEPSPYPNTVLSKTATQNNDNKVSNSNSGSGNVRQKPILSNQQINLHAGVLNHDVDINVPPLTFRKEIEFPHSTAVKGHTNQHIRKNGPFEMPHITILPSDQEIHVNLTPQHYILSEMFLQNENGHSPNKFSPLPLPVKRKPFQNHDDSSPYKNITKIPISNQEKLKTPLPIPTLNRSPNIPPIYPPFNNKFKNPGQPQSDFKAPPPLPPPPSSQQMPPFSPPPYIPHQQFNDQSENMFQNQRYPMKKSPRPLPPPPPSNLFSGNHQTYPALKYQPQKLRPVSHIPPIENIFDIKLSKIPSHKPITSDISLNIGQNSVLYYDNAQKVRTTTPYPSIYINNDNIYLSVNQTYAGTENIETYFDTQKGQKVNISSHLHSHEDFPYDDHEYDSDTKSSEHIVHNFNRITNRTKTQTPHTSKVTNAWPTTIFTKSTTTPQVKLFTATEKIPSTTSFKVQDRIKQRPSPFDINELHQIETAPPLPAPPQEKPSISIPSKGRPFHNRHPYTKKPPITNSQPSIFQDDLIVLPKPGQRFRKPPSNNKNIFNSMTTNSVYDNFTENIPPFIQMSLPIDPHDTDNYKVSRTQTESPFRYPNSNGLEETTTRKPTSTSTMSTTSNWNLNLNTLEVFTKSKTENDKDSGEIFDYRESVNPHNLGVIANSATNENKITRNITKSTVKPNYGNRKTTIRNSVLIPTTSYPFVSEPSINMKPPAPSIPSLVTNDVMGLSPPPPPTSLSPPPSSSVSSSSSSVASMYDTTLLNENYMSHNGKRQQNTIPPFSRPFVFTNQTQLFSNSHQPHKDFNNFDLQNTVENKLNFVPTIRASTTTTTTTKTKLETSTKITITSPRTTKKQTMPPSTSKAPQTPHPIFAVTVKATHNFHEQSNNSFSTTITKQQNQDQQFYQTKQSDRNEISPTPIVKNDFYDYIPISSSKSPNNNDVSFNSSPVYTGMMDESQIISDDILMLGSEYPYQEDDIKSIVYPSPEGPDIERTIILLPDDSGPIENRTKTTISSNIKESSTQQKDITADTKTLKMTITKTLDYIENTFMRHTPVLTVSSTLGTPTIIEIVTKAHTERVNVYPTRTQIKSTKITTATATTTTTLYTSLKNKEYYNHHHHYHHPHHNHNHHHDGIINGTVIVLNPPVVKMKPKPTIEFEIIDYDEPAERYTKTTLLRPSIIPSSSFSPSFTSSVISMPLPRPPQASLSPSSISISFSSSSTLPSFQSTIILTPHHQPSPPSLPPTTPVPPSVITFTEKHNRKEKPSPSSPQSPHSSMPTENESIFVVMTDKSNSGGIIHFNGTVLDAENSVDEPDYTNISFDVPNRDEDFSSNEANHVLLGGILIATPPKSKDVSKYSSSTNAGGGGRLGVSIGNIGGSECRPDCKASRNELCQRVENIMKCVCRPGFARMFPDRPCKPTYTYSLRLKLHKFGSDSVLFHEHLNNKDSDAYFYLSGIVHEALDRMVMQSDFRDVYHGVHVTGFERSDTDDEIISNFYLQLSDNSDENRLIDVFKKYLRTKNYSIGGTELYTSKDGVEELKASDFNECLNSQFHDCSENSYCFNLHGTYTCSCKEGYADLSENSLYPGRICSTELIGCEQCHYHGTCYTPDDMEYPICECFHWYAGSACQLNLKILLIALIAIGTILLILLLFCIIVLCMKKRKTTTRNIQTLAGINIMPPKNIRHHFNPCNIKIDKRAMIKDSSSETSHNSDVIPYVSKKEEKKMSIISQSQSIQKAHQHHQQQQQQQQQQQHQRRQQQQAEIERRCSLLDQNNRSLSVMIPRAKYYSASHQIPSSSSHLIPSEGVGGNGSGGGVNGNGGGRNSCNAETNSKILSYLDAGAQVTNAQKKFSSSSTKQHSALHTTSTGALVSAGFEVSATVRQDAGLSSGDEINHHHHHRHHQKMIIGSGALEHQKNRTNLDDIIDESQQGAFMENMDNWFDTMQQNELTASEARSYDETTIRPPTKTLRSVYEKHVSQLNDEANTMAEREIGSTFLLPHTHLYKPDRASDFSGFDSF